LKKYTEKRERKYKERKEERIKRKERKTFYYSATDVIYSSDILSLYSLQADIDKTYYIYGKCKGKGHPRTGHEGP